MNKHEIFSRKVLDILADSCDWDDERIVLEIAHLAESMGLATGGCDGEFEIIGPGD